MRDAECERDGHGRAAAGRPPSRTSSRAPRPARAASARGRRSRRAGVRTEDGSASGETRTLRRPRAFRPRRRGRRRATGAARRSPTPRPPALRARAPARRPARRTRRRSSRGALARRSRVRRARSSSRRRAWQARPRSPASRSRAVRRPDERRSCRPRPRVRRARRRRCTRTPRRSRVRPARASADSLRRARRTRPRRAPGAARVRPRPRRALRRPRARAGRPAAAARASCAWRSRSRTETLASIGWQKREDVGEKCASIGKVIGKRERRMRGAVAAGHPLTTQAGARVLEEGGNAVDACVAAAFASWVAESPLTGPGAGGFALVHSADGRPERLADFFVATPGPAGRAEPGRRDARDRRRVRRRRAGDPGLSDRRALMRRPGCGGRARGAAPRLRACCRGPSCSRRRSSLRAAESS